MAKKAVKKPKAKAAAKKKVAKAAPKKPAAPAALDENYGDKLTFNHAMIYSKDVSRSTAFYHDLLGFKLIEDFRFENKPVYARLRAPGGDGTIAIHEVSAGGSLISEGVRLYFEIRELDDFCRKLQQKNFYITQMPRMMPWGWRHAYLNDPDGHEISIYWAGDMRMKKSILRAVREVEKAPAAKKS